MKALTLLLMAGLLIGGDCRDDGPIVDPPRPDPNFYCAPAVLEPEPGLLESVGRSLAAIVGGEPSVDRRSTFFVHALGEGYCTGTAIDARTVVTAAHCIGSGDHRIELRFQDRTETWDVIDVKGHPDFETDPIQWYRGDIALMLVGDDLPGPFAPIYPGASMAAECQDIVCQGHGTDYDGDTPTTLLQEVPCRVEQQFEFLLATDGREAGQGICFGDSGGPLYAIVGGVPQLAGVTSWTRDRNCLRGSGHISAEYYRDWIEANRHQEE